MNPFDLVHFIGYFAFALELGGLIFLLFLLLVGEV